MLIQLYNKVRHKPEEQVQDIQRKHIVVFVGTLQRKL